MAKQLNMKAIKEESQIYNETVEIPVEVNNETYSVKIYPYFSPVKVTDLFNSMSEFYKKADKEKVNVKDEEFDAILGYFIVREFTDIKMTTSKKAKTIYDEYKVAINSKLFNVILTTIPEESMKYVYEKLFEFQEMNAKLENKFRKLQEQMKSLPLEHRDVIEKAFGNGDVAKNVKADV